MKIKDKKSGSNLFINIVKYVLQHVILGIADNANLEQIKAAYQRICTSMVF